MKLGIGYIALVLVALLASAACADSPPATKVMILRFASLTPSGDVDWIGSALQQSIVTDLSRRGGIMPAAGGVDDAAAPLAAARKAGASYFIVGNFQIVNGNLRVLGQIFQAPDGKPVAGLHVTGALSDVFTIEDDLAYQVRRELPPLSVTAPTTQPGNSSTELATSTPPPDNGPLRAASYVPQIAPLPHGPPGDPWVLLNGPPDFWEFGFGHGGYGGWYGFGGYGVYSWGGACPP